MTTPTAEIFDIHGHTVFCDDIRHEVGGKLTFVGVYTESMFVNAEFPVNVSKLGFHTRFYQKPEIFDPNLSLKIFLPGDPEDAPSIEADLQQKTSEPSSKPDSNTVYAMVVSNLTFSALTLNSPGLIKVRVLRQGVLHRVGTLKVVKSSFPTASP